MRDDYCQIKDKKNMGRKNVFFFMAYNFSKWIIKLEKLKGELKRYSIFNFQPYNKTVKELKKFFVYVDKQTIIKKPFYNKSLNQECKRFLFLLFKEMKKAYEKHILCKKIKETWNSNNR